MADNNIPSANSSVISATYSSPRGNHTFTYPKAPSASSSARSTEAKTQYLSSLRQSASELQKDINGFLTAEMEADKAAASSQGEESKKNVETKEEENYGEEVIDED